MISDEQKRINLLKQRLDSKYLSGTDLIYIIEDMLPGDLDGSLYDFEEELDFIKFMGINEKSVSQMYESGSINITEDKEDYLSWAGRTKLLEKVLEKSVAERQKFEESKSLRGETLGWRKFNLHHLIRSKQDALDWLILLDVDSGFKDSLKMVDKAISDKIKSRIHRIKDEITGSRLAYYTDFFWEKCSKQSYVDYIEKLKKELESTKADLKNFKQEVDLEKGLKQISM